MRLPPYEAPLPPNEPERLHALHSLQLLDTHAAPPVEALTRLVREHFGAATATVSLIDAGRQWFHALAGELKVRETARRDAFCSWTVLEDTLLVVPDTLLDARFRDARLVQGPPHIRFYAGAPLHVDGLPIGVLCVFDPQPRAFSAADGRLLSGMAEAVAALLAAQRMQREALAMGQLLESVVEEAYLFDLAGERVLHANAGASPRLGYDAAALRRLRPQDISACYQREVFEARPHIGQGDDARWKFDTTQRRADGSEYAVSVYAARAPVAGADCVVVTVRNIEERKRSERELARMAHHDRLTGLANRWLLEDRYAKACERAARHGGLLALLLIDLDGFKPINDQFGHATGDAVLVHVARVLEATVRAGDTVARTGGDEFVVLLDGLHDRAEADSLHSRLRDALARTRCEPIGRPVAASLGLSLGGGVDELAQLMAEADAAMYASKPTRRR